MSRCGKWVPGGMIPTTVFGSEFNGMLRPMMLVSPPKCRCQNPWLKSTAWGLPILQFPRLKGQRQPELHVTLWEMGSRRHDSNHGLRLGIQRDASANDAGITAKMSLPESVAQEHGVGLADIAVPKAQRPTAARVACHAVGNGFPAA